MGDAESPRAEMVFETELSVSYTPSGTPAYGTSAYQRWLDERDAARQVRWEQTITSPNSGKCIQTAISAHDGRTLIAGRATGVTREFAKFLETKGYTCQF